MANENTFRSGGRPPSRVGEPPPYLALPPRDWHDVEGWEHFWEAQIAGLTRSWFTLNACFVSREVLEEMLRAGRTRILFAGNGISLEPYAFAHAGFDATALDVSRTAADYMADAHIDARVLARLFAERDIIKREGYFEGVHNEAKSLATVRRLRRPGGVLRSVNADLFRHEPQAQHDVIASIRAFQGFEACDRDELARRFFDWLSPGGLCVVETINVGAQRSLQRTFVDAGFAVERRVTLGSKTGRKTVVFVHGSG